VEIGKDNGYLTLLVFNIISLANDVTWVWQDNKGVNVVPEYCVNLENLRAAFNWVKAVIQANFVHSF